MKNFLLGAAFALGFSVATVAVLIQIGATDFAADDPHGPLVYSFIEWARERSIARRSADIVAPADLADVRRIRRGAGNYAAMCAECHLAPGVEDSEIRKGLYPTPANLAKPAGGADSGSTDARRFWIVKHGIKASGMPAWSKGGMEDEAIWDLTAFLKAMPDLSPAEYRSLVEASDGHSHGGVDGHGVEPRMTHERQHNAPAHPHNPDAHAH